MIYNGAIHVHTTLSDGSLNLVDVRDFFVGKGFHFVCVTEHYDFIEHSVLMEFVRDCCALSGQHFILIPGIEFSFTDESHVLAMGITSHFARNSTSSAKLELIDQIRNQGGLAILAHPEMTQYTIEKQLLGNLDGLEFWNARYDGSAFPNPLAIRLLRKTSPALFGIGGLDFHEQCNVPFSISVEAAKLTSSEILAKLKRGEFRISTPQFSVSPGGVVVGRSHHSVDGFWKIRQKQLVFTSMRFLARKLVRSLGSSNVNIPPFFKTAAKRILKG